MGPGTVPFPLVATAIVDCPGADVTQEGCPGDPTIPPEEGVDAERAGPHHQGRPDPKLDLRKAPKPSHVLSLILRVLVIKGAIWGAEVAGGEMLAVEEVEPFEDGGIRARLVVARWTHWIGFPVGERTVRPG